MDTTRSAWMANAEAAIRSLRDVDGVSIQMDGEEIREIHVISGSHRPAKQIVRDIRTLLLTRFQRSIDHRVVSVVFTDPPLEQNGQGDHDAGSGSQPDPAPRSGSDTDLDDVLEAPQPPGTSAADAPARPDPAPAAAEEVATPTGERIRFGSVNLYVNGRRAQAQVELRWKGVPRLGSASGWSTRDGALRLIAQSTLVALQEFLDESVAFGLDSVQIVRAGRRDVAVVALDLLVHRAQKPLVGCCTVEQDAQEAVVLATLSALNRIIGGLPTREPTEYVLRPTST